MFDFSYIDPRLLFPNISEGFAMSIESIKSVLDFVTLTLMIIAEWKLFKKFGEKPWKSLILYYNSYIMYKHTWSKKAFWTYFISSTLFNIIHTISKFLAQNQPDNMWMTLLVLISLPLGIIAAVCSILYAFRFAEAFGKGKLFSAGLLLVYPIFISILGLGKCKYISNSDTESIGIQTEDPCREGVVI